MNIKTGYHPVLGRDPTGFARTPARWAVCRLKSAISENTAMACFCEVLTGKRIQVANGAWFGDEAPGVLPSLWPFINDPARRRARKVAWVVETAPRDRPTYGIAAKSHARANFVAATPRRV